MTSSTIQAQYLQRIAHELLFLGTDGTPIYTNYFVTLNQDVLLEADKLFAVTGSTPEEEADICLALLMAYSATIYDHGDKEKKKQSVLNRCWNLFEELPDSLLKCKLLIYCYGEVFEEELSQNAYAIIESWNDRELSQEKKEIIETLQNMENNQYPHCEIDE